VATVTASAVLPASSSAAPSSPSASCSWSRIARSSARSKFSTAPRSAGSGSSTVTTTS
jgi:hypothetical protein